MGTSVIRSMDSKDEITLHREALERIHSYSKQSWMMNLKDLRHTIVRIRNSLFNLESVLKEPEEVSDE